MILPAADPIPLPSVGPSGRTDQFRPLAAAADALAGFSAADRERLAGGRIVVGPSGQVWCLSGCFPELIGTSDPAPVAGAVLRVRPMPWALTPEQRAALVGYPRSGLRAVRAASRPLAAETPAEPAEIAPGAPESVPAAPEGFGSSEPPIVAQRAPGRVSSEGKSARARRTRGLGKGPKPPVVPWAGGTIEERATEMTRRREAGEKLASLAEAFGLSISGVHRAIEAHRHRQQLRREAVA